MKWKYRAKFILLIIYRLSAHFLPTPFASSSTASDAKL
jgi:hypothetical protein